MEARNMQLVRKKIAEETFLGIKRVSFGLQNFSVSAKKGFIVFAIVVGTHFSKGVLPFLAEMK